MILKKSLKKGLLGAARKLGGGSRLELGPLVLCHHAVDSSGGPFTVAPEVFRAQMNFLLEQRACWMTVAELGRALRHRTFPPRAVCVTFDDGVPSSFEPILWLVGAGGKCSQFVVTDRVEDAGRRGEATARSLNWSRLEELARAAVEIGSHTAGHRDLTQLGDGELHRELAGSKNLLEQRLQRSIESLAYPFGLLNSRVVRAAAGAGYMWGCTTQHVHASPLCSPLAIPRHEPLDVESLAELFEGRGWIFYGALQGYFLIRNALVLR